MATLETSPQPKRHAVNNIFANNFYQMYVVSYNVAQLPWPYNAMPDAEARMHAICNHLLQHPEFIVVCMQELFSKKAREIVRKRLGNVYRHIQMDEDSGKFCIGVNSGLAILSQLPISSPLLIEYKDKRDIDIFTRKGLLGCRVAIPSLLYSSSISELFIFTTHLQAGGSVPVLSWFASKTADEIKYDQITQACRDITNVLSKSGTRDAYVLLCGDFNLNATSEIHEALRRIYIYFPYARDSFDSVTSPQQNSTPSSRIDYQIVLKSPLRVSSQSTIGIFGNYNMSDHMPTVLKIEPKTTSMIHGLI
jgi:endonuclease/exonuclease/phosphatase family metal-dependent hydrolase